MTDWTFAGTWPYKPRYFEAGAGERLHYIDEGPRDAQPVLLLHGNPTWSYMYRRVIAPLISEGRRVIAVDHLGFGRSAIPADESAYTVVRHRARLRALLAEFDLYDVTVVLHDWSGPIALPWVAESSDRVAGLLLLNTFPPRLPGPIGERGSLRMLRSKLLGPWLVQKRDVPTEEFLFRSGTAKPDAFDETTKSAYRAPHPGPTTRLPMLVFPREIPLSESAPLARESRHVAEQLPTRLAGKPIGLCWGMKDKLFGPAVLREWAALLPRALLTEVPDAGHFLVEDSPDAVIGALAILLAGGNRGQPSPP